MGSGALTAVAAAASGARGGGAAVLLAGKPHAAGDEQPAQGRARVMGAPGLAGGQ